MKTRICAALAFGLAISFSGCATPSAGINYPAAINASKREKIKAGLSREQVISLLGEPESRVALAEGESLFFKDANLCSVWVYLDKAGKVKDLEWSE